MEITLKVFDPFDDWHEVDAHLSSRNIVLKYLASELIDEFGYQDVHDLDKALQRTFDVCCSMNIPISAHFHKIYRDDQHMLAVDWELSDLACYLLLLNGDASNPNVAKAQLFYLICFGNSKTSAT